MSEEREPKIIEYGEVKKSNNILFFCLIGALAALAVVFLLLWVLKPSRDTGELKSIAFVQNNPAAEFGLAENTVDGQTVFSASTGRTYLVSVTLSAEHNADTRIAWTASPAEFIKELSVNPSPDNPNIILYEFKVEENAPDGLQARITARGEAAQNVVAELNFVVRRQFTETVSYQSVQNIRNSAEYIISSGAVSVPFFTAAHQSEYNFVSVDFLAEGGAYHRSQGAGYDGRDINALSYSIVSGSDFIQLVNVNEGSEHVRLRLMGRGKAVLQVQANRFNPWRDEDGRDYTVQLEINTVDPIQLGILTEITLDDSHASVVFADGMYGVEIFAHETISVGINANAFELRSLIRTNPAKRPDSGDWVFSAPAEVFQDGTAVTLSADRYLSTSFGAQFTLVPQRAGKTYVRINEVGGYGAQAVVRVLIHKRITSIGSVNNEDENSLTVYGTTSQTNVAANMVYRIDTRPDGASPDTQYIKNTLFFSYKDKSEEPLMPQDAGAGYVFLAANAAEYDHTAIINGMQLYGEDENGKNIYTVSAPLQMPGSAGGGYSGVLTLSIGAHHYGIDSVLNFWLEPQFAVREEAEVTFVLTVKIAHTPFGINFNFDDFGDIARGDAGAYFFAANASWQPVAQSADATHAVLVRSFSAQNVNVVQDVGYSVFQLLSYYDTGGTQLDFESPSDMAAGITIDSLGYSENSPVSFSRHGALRTVNTIGTVDSRYTLTISAEGATPVGTQKTLNLRVIYLEQAATLTLADAQPRVVEYGMLPAGGIALSLPTVSETTISNRTTALSDSEDALTADIFVSRDNVRQKLYRNEINGVSYYFDYEYADNPLYTADINNALFSRSQSGGITIRRDLYLYSSQEGRCFNEFEILYAKKLTLDFADTVLDEVFAPYIKFSAIRSFDDIALFRTDAGTSDADEMLMSKLNPAPFRISKGTQIELYAFGIIHAPVAGGGIEKLVVRPDLSDNFIDRITLFGPAATNANIEQLSANAFRAGGVTDYTGDETARLRVATHNQTSETQFTLTLEFKVKVPIVSIEVFSEFEPSPVVLNETVRLHNAGVGTNTRNIYALVTYNVSVHDTAQYEHYGLIAAQETHNIGNVSMRYFVESGRDSNNHIEFTEIIANAAPQVEAISSTEIAFTRLFRIELTARTNFAGGEMHSEYVFTSFDNSNIASSPFEVSVSNYADAIEIRGADTDAHIGANIHLTMELSANGHHAEAWHDIAIGQISPLNAANLSQNYVFDIRINDDDAALIRAEDAIGGEYVFDGIVRIQALSNGRFRIWSQGSVQDGVKIEFFLRYSAPAGFSDAPVLVAPLMLFVHSDVFTISLSNDELYNGALKILVDGSAGTLSRNDLALIFNGGDADFTPLAGFTVSVRTFVKGGDADETFPVAFTVRDGRFLEYSVPHNIERPLNTYALEFTVTNLSGRVLKQSIDILTATSDFALEIIDIYDNTNPLSRFTPVSGETSIFAENTRFVTQAVNVWDASVMYLWDTATIADQLYGDAPVVAFNAGAGGAFGSGANANLLTVDPATAAFTVTVSAQNQANALRTANVTVYKYNRIESLTPIAGRMPRITETAANQYAVTLITGYDLDLYDFIAINSAAVNVPVFNSAFTVAPQAAASTGIIQDGTRLRATQAAASMVYEITAAHHAADSVPAVRIALTVEVVDLSIEITAISAHSTAPLILGQSNQFTFSYAVYKTDYNGTKTLYTDANLNHRITDFALTQPSGHFIFSYAHDEALQTFTVTLQQFSSDKILTSNDFITAFRLVCFADGQELISPDGGLDAHFRVVDTNAVAIGLDAPALQAVADGYRADILTVQTINATPNAPFTAQLEKLNQLFGGAFTHAYSYTNASNVLNGITARPNFESVISLSGNTGEVFIWLSFNAAGLAFASQEVSLEVYTSGVLEPEFYTGSVAGGIFTPVSLLSDTFSVDFGAAAVGTREKTDFYLVTAYAAAFGVNSLNYSDIFLAEITHGTAVLTALENGIAEMPDGTHVFYQRYTLTSVSQPNTAVSFRVTAAVHNQTYTARADLTLTAQEADFAFPARVVNDTLTLISGETVTIAPFIQNRAANAGASGFFGSFTVSYTFTQNNVGAALLNVAADGSVTAQPRITPSPHNTALLRVTVQISDGAYKGAIQHFNIEVIVDAAAAPEFSLKQGADIDVARAPAPADTISINLSDYIDFDFDAPDTHGAAQFTFNVTAWQGDSRYGIAAEVVRTGSGADAVFTFPNRLFYFMLTVDLSVTAGQWQGYTDSLTLEFFVRPDELGFIDVENQPQLIFVEDTYTLTAGDSIQLSSAGYDTAFDGASGDVSHAQIVYSIAEVVGGTAGAKRTVINGIGFIEEDRFNTYAAARGGVVTLYVSLEISSGPYAGRAYAFDGRAELTVHVLALSGVKDRAPDVNRSFADGGDIFIRSGETISLGASGGMLLFDRTAISFPGGTFTPSVRLVNDVNTWYLSLTGTDLSVAHGAYFGASGSDPIHLGAAVEVSVEQSMYWVTYRRVFNLYIMPQSPPTVTVGAAAVSIAGDTPLTHSGLGVPTVYAGDQLTFEVSSDVAAVQQIEFFITGVNGGNPVATQAAQGLPINYVVPQTLAVGTYQVYARALIGGAWFQTDAPVNAFTVALPDTSGAAYSVSASTPQLFNGSFTEFTVEKDASANQITRVIFEFSNRFNPALVTLNGTDVSGLVKQNGTLCTIDFTPALPADALTLRLYSQSSATVSATISATVFNYIKSGSSANLSSGYRFLSAAQVELLAASEQAKLVLPLDGIVVYGAADVPMFVQLSATRLEFKNINDLVFTVSDPRVTAEPVLSGGQFTGEIRLFVPADAFTVEGRIVANFTLVSYTVGGATITDGTWVEAEFFAAPQFTVSQTAAMGDYSVTVASALQTEVSFEIISGSMFVRDAFFTGSISQGTSVTIGFTPNYIAGETNEVLVRIVCKITRAGAFYGYTEVLDTVLVTFEDDLGLSSVGGILEEAREGSLSLIGSLSLDTLATSIMFEVEGAAWEDYFTKFDNDSFASRLDFIFKQSLTPQEVTVKITITLFQGTYTYFKILHNYAVPSPDFTVEVDRFTVTVTAHTGGESITANLGAHQILSGEVHVQSSTTTDNTFTITPDFFQDAANTVYVRLAVTVTQADSAYYGQTFNVFAEIVIPTILTGEITESPRTDALRLSGRINAPTPGAVTVTYQVSAADYDKFEKSPGFPSDPREFTFKQSLVRQEVTVTITASYQGARYYYTYILVNEPVPQPDFTLSYSGYSVTVEASIGGESLAFALEEAEVLGGANHVQAFTVLGDTFSFTPIFIQGGVNQAYFLLRLRITDLNSPFYTESGTFGFALFTETITVTNRYAALPDAFGDTRSTTGGLAQSRLSGTVTGAPDAGVTVTYTALVNDYTQFFTEVPFGIDNPLFTFKKSFVSQTVTVEIAVTHLDGSGVYIYYYTLTNQPFPVFTVVNAVTSLSISGGTHDGMGEGMVEVLLPAGINAPSAEFYFTSSTTAFFTHIADAKGTVIFPQNTGRYQLSGYADLTLDNSFYSGTYRVEFEDLVFIFPDFEVFGFANGVNGYLYLRANGISDAMFADATTFVFDAHSADYIMGGAGGATAVSPTAAEFKLTSAHTAATLSGQVTFALNALSPYGAVTLTMPFSLNLENWADFTVELADTPQGGTLTLTHHNTGADAVTYSFMLASGDEKFFVTDFSALTPSDTVFDSQIFEYVKLHNINGGFVTLEITMTFTGGTIVKTVEIYIPPAIPTLVISAEEDMGGGEYEIRVSVQTPHGELYGITSFTTDILSPMPLIAPVSGYPQINGGGEIVYRYTKLTAPVDGITVIRITLQIEEVAGEFNGFASIATTRTAAVISKEITTTPDQLQNTYRVRLNPDDAPPASWRAAYRIEFDNPAQEAIKYEFDTESGVLNYWYNQQESGSVQFTVFADIYYTSGGTEFLVGTLSRADIIAWTWTVPVSIAGFNIGTRVTVAGTMTTGGFTLGGTTGARRFRVNYGAAAWSIASHVSVERATVTGGYSVEHTPDSTLFETSVLSGNGITDIQMTIEFNLGSHYSPDASDYYVVLRLERNAANMTAVTRLS
ncbi:MAG: hypothetical protein FWH03_01145 [Firmicutes bacterium]|nr:hypothetical protein [Bacillota bacterium]